MNVADDAIEYRRLLALYAKLAAFVQRYTVDDIDAMVMGGAIGRDWPDVDATAPLVDLPKWSTLAPADPSHPQWLGVPSNEYQRVREVVSAASHVREELRKLTTISREHACELAEALDDLTVADGYILATRARVAAIGLARLTKFQIPLATYFLEVLQLSDSIVRVWHGTTLSIQLRVNCMRLMLHRVPTGWGLAVSVNKKGALILDNATVITTINYQAGELDAHHLAIVPFGPS
jgi:hypothetical protein